MDTPTPRANRNVNRARKTWVLRAKAFSHRRKGSGKRDSSKALRRVGKAICRAWL